MRVLRSLKPCFPLPCSWGVPDASDTSLPSCTCDVISCLLVLTAFPVVFVVVVLCHWLVVVMVTLASLANQLEKQTHGFTWCHTHSQSCWGFTGDGVKEGCTVCSVKSL